MRARDRRLQMLIGGGRLGTGRQRLLDQFQLAAVRLQTAARLRAMAGPDATAPEGLAAAAQVLESMVGDMPTAGRA